MLDRQSVNSLVEGQELLDPLLMAVAVFARKPLQICVQGNEHLVVDTTACQADGLALQQARTW